MSLGSEITNLSIENTDKNSILLSWDVLGPVLEYGNVITFSIYLRTPNYVLVTTTKDLEIELAPPLLSNVNYTILVELQLPFTTDTISATFIYFLANISSTATTSIPQTSSDTTTVMNNLLLQNTNLLTPYSCVMMIGIMIIIILMALAFLFLFIICLHFEETCY